MLSIEVLVIDGYDVMNEQHGGYESGGNLQVGVSLFVLVLLARAWGGGCHDSFCVIFHVHDAAKAFSLMLGRNSMQLPGTQRHGGMS